MRLRRKSAEPLNRGQKKGPREISGPYSFEGNLNLQRGTADAAALGGNPPCASTTGDMVVLWATRNARGRMTAMRVPHGTHVRLVKCLKYLKKNSTG